jgi:hypothetical protein
LTNCGVNDNRMTTEELAYKRTKLWAIAGIIISWITFWIFLFSPFGLLVWIGILIYLIVNRSKLWWYLAFSAWFFVPSFSFLLGTTRYFSGTAFLQGVGGPMIYHGIDRETRVRSISSGCIFVGFEPFVFLPNNAAVRLWTNLLGYQKGSYNGVFPTENEAKEIIKLGDKIVAKQTGQHYQFTSDNQLVKVDVSDFNRLRYAKTSLDTVVGKVINNECFIFQQVSSKEIDNRKTIYLVDIKKNKLLNQYFGYY